MTKRTVGVFGLALFLAIGGTGATVRVEERVRSRLARAPVVLLEREPGDCDGITAETLRVLEDGVPADRLFLDPSPRDAAHAILIDVGPGMLSHLADARWAASVYANALPAEAAAMLATADHRLLLRTTWSTDRVEFEQGTDWIEPGAACHLWRSTRDLIRYLRIREGRKALILLTRGCDTEGAGGVSFDEVLTAAASTEALSVFPIAIDMPAKCEVGGVDPRPALNTLASRTGGKLFRVAEITEIEPVLAEIRRRLGDEKEIAWSPLPFGAGPKDKPKKGQARWREIEIRSTGRPRCEISIAGSPLRCEAAEGSSACLFGPSSSPAGAGPFALSADGLSLSGTVRDVVRDGGVVAPTLDDLLVGSVNLDSARPALVQGRSVSAWLRGVDELVDPQATAEDVVFHALSRASRFSASGELAPQSATPKAWTQSPFLVNGTTLFAISESLTRGLLERPDYRRWLDDRVRRERLEALDRWIAVETERAPETQSALLAARQAVAEGPVVLEADESVRFLGAWLGDLPAARVFQASEAWLAQKLLETLRTSGRERLAAAWSEVERMWALVQILVPEPRDVALLAWLVPGYDPVQQVVGYQRIILAQPHSTELKDMILNATPGDYIGTSGVATAAESRALFEHFQSFNYARDTPYGATFVRWMLQHEELAALLQSNFDVDIIRYAHSAARDLLPTLQRSGLAKDAGKNATVLARQVSLRLRSRETKGPGLMLGAYFQTAPADGLRLEKFEPLCLVLFPDHALNDQERALLRTLIDVPRRLPCVL